MRHWQRSRGGWPEDEALKDALSPPVYVVVGCVVLAVLGAVILMAVAVFWGAAVVAMVRGIAGA